MTKSLETDDIAFLDRQIADLKQKREEAIAAKRTSALEEARKLVKTFGFSADDLGIVIKPVQKRASPKIKYKHPETGLTWTGKGRCPAGLQGADGKVNPRYLVE